MAPCFRAAPANRAAGSKLLPQQQRRRFSLRLAPSLPLDGSWEEGGELAASWTNSSGNGSCSQPPFCPRVICLSHPRHVTLMRWESSQAAIRKGWGRVGAAAAARTIHLTRSPVPYTLQSRARGRRLLGTGCGPDKWACLPRTPALRRTSTCFLQPTVLVFPNCSVPLIIGWLFVRFPCARTRSTKEGAGLTAPLGSWGSGDSPISHSPAFVPVWPRAHHVRSSEVFGCRPPTEPSKKEKPEPCHEKADASIPSLPGPLRRRFWPTEIRVMAGIQRSRIWERVVQTLRKSCTVTSGKETSSNGFSCDSEIVKSLNKSSYLKVLPKNIPSLFFFF